MRRCPRCQDRLWNGHHVSGSCLGDGVEQAVLDVQDDGDVGGH